MANRSYLFAFDEFENGAPLKPRGVHEWNYDIPISHLLLMSGRPRAYRSCIWNAKVAIVADYEAGVDRMLRFMRALEASGKLTDLEEFAKALREAEEFLCAPKPRGRFFLLEPGEIFMMEKGLPEALNTKLVESRIPTHTKAVDALLAKPVARLFSSAPTWLADVRKDWQRSALGLKYFSDVLYFKLD